MYTQTKHTMNGKCIISIIVFLPAAAAASPAQRSTYITVCLSGSVYYQPSHVTTCQVDGGQAAAAACLAY